MGPHDILTLFNEMQVLGRKPNVIMLVSVLRTCVDLLALEKVKISMVMQQEVHLNMMLSQATYLLTCMPNVGILALPTNCLNNS